MKKGMLIHSDLSLLVATLGHMDQVTICDAGLPIPESVQRIDLALTHGVPAFIDTVQVMLAECQIQAVTLAEEFQTVSPDHHRALLEALEHEQQATGKAIDISYVSHELFKQQTHQSRAVIRTGECTPYANIIFHSGVVF